MKRFIALMLGLGMLLLPSSGFADVFTQRIDFSSTNGPSSFGGTNGLLTFGGATIHRIQTVMVNNRGTLEVALNCSSTSTVVPADSSVHNIYVNGSEGWQPPAGTGFGNACYLRCFTGTCTSGVVVVSIIGS